MNTIQLLRTLRASYAFVERNFNLVRRYWGWEVVWLAYSIANTLSITYIGAGMEAISGVQVDTNYLILYLLIGTMVWRFLAIIFDNISEMIAWKRWEGTIEYTLMAPITRLTHMMGQTAFAVAYSLLFTLVILGVVVLFFHLDLSGANLGGGDGGAAIGESFLHRTGHRRVGAAAVVPGAGRADDERPAGRFPAHLRRLLPGGGASGLDTATGTGLPRDLCAGGDAGGHPARRVHGVPLALSLASAAGGSRLHPVGAGDFPPG